MKYYDCPIKAAFMAQHYGVKYQIPWGPIWAARECVINSKRETWGQPGSSGEANYVTITFKGGALTGTCVRFGIVDHRVDDIYTSEDVPEKLYIHPDSLSIFEPREGDVILDDIGTLFSYTRNFGGHFDSIIQRNSEAFHWPKEEK